MLNIAALTLTVGVALLLAGCANDRHVLFVTKTSIGIDFDSKPAAASLAYDRVEGYIAPRYSNGEIPPVIASIKSDGAIFNPKIHQVYATGEAAEIVLRGAGSGTQTKRLKGTKELMFFGTTTTTGLKVGFASGLLPDSFIFGFKRKEFSYIPLGTLGAGATAYDVYPSILATIDTQANVGKGREAELSNAQFFATGNAARLLAANPGVRKGFEHIAKEAVQAEQLKNVENAMTESDKKSALVVDIVERFEDATTTQRQDIIALAHGGPIDPNRQMTVEIFEQKLRRFAAEDPPPGVNVLQQLENLNNKIDELLTQ